jgi:hypothetical protein
MSATSSRAELASRTAETVEAAGQLARLISKASSSPALQSTIAAFAEYEATIESTDMLLRKINEGMVVVDEAVEEVHATIAGRPSS